MQNSNTYPQMHEHTNADIILQLEDTIIILSEQIKTLKLELDDKNEELEEVKQELVYTNQELCIANELFFTNLAPQPNNQSKKLANDLLTS